MGEGFVALSSMKINAVDGVAFVDFGATGVLTDNIGRLLKIYDSSRRAITGRIYTPGTVETLGEEKVTNGGFGADTDWDKEGTWSIAGGVAHAVNESGADIYQDIGAVNGVLYKTTFSVSNYVDGLIRFRLSTGLYAYGPNFNSNGAKTIYLTSSSTILRIGGENLATFDLDNVSSKQVLTPSATGVLIVSEDMITRNWTSKDSSFNYSDVAGYTFDFEPEPVMRGIGRGRLYAYMNRR